MPTKANACGWIASSGNIKRQAAPNSSPDWAPSTSKGANKSARQIQASSGLFFDVFTRYDPGNLLVGQAHREVLERQLESSRLGRTLERLAVSRVVITEPPRTPPLAFPLLVDRTREAVTSESLADRVQRMQVALERYADQGEAKRAKK